MDLPGKQASGRLPRLCPLPAQSEPFLGVQWTRLPGGGKPAEFCQRVQRLLDRSAGNLPESGPTNRGQDDRATLLSAPPGAPSKLRRPRWFVPALCSAGIALALI